jgi:hypothetical protein
MKLSRQGMAKLFVRTAHSRPIHFAGAGSVAIAHRNEGGVLVREIVAQAERVGVWIGRAGRRGVVQPRGGLDVVLRGRGLGAAGGWGCAEPLKQVVRRAVFLDDEDDMLEG